jgi:tRNA isopentenyl-2-thiomethyl-A-37 hydroxylase MiaE
MSIKKEDMKSLDELIIELSKINEALFQINNHIAGLVMIYQMQLMTNEEIKQLQNLEDKIIKKKLH